LTHVWIDEGKIKGQQRGQFIYDLTIGFGDKALDNYKDELDLKDCLPDQTMTTGFGLIEKKEKLKYNFYKTQPICRLMSDK
jgi:hypothetical protein